MNCLDKRTNMGQSQSAPPSQPSTPHIASLTLDDIYPHLRTTVFFTGAFVAAWSWDLVVYGSSHAWVGENPVVNQLSFAKNQRYPKQLVVLLLQYLLVCGGAAIVSDAVHRLQRPWSKAAVTAVEFFPSPIFAGKLMAYLGQFSSSLGLVDQALVNLAATWFAASLAHAMPLLHNQLQSLQIMESLFGEQGRMRRLGDIVRNTLGFGLGIAWNVLLIQCFPSPSSGSIEIVHILGLAGYLAVVTMIAFRLAAVAGQEPDESSSDLTISVRQLALLSFASYVVCAFTLVAFLNAILHSGWLGELESLGVLFLLSAAMSAMVSHVDFEAISEQRSSSGIRCDDEEEEDEGLDHHHHHHHRMAGLQHEPCWKVIFLLLVLVPCFWWCCAWVPVVYLLAGTGTLGVKEHWHQLISMVAGLACSIQASGLLTETTDAVAAMLKICDVRHCGHAWRFVALQALFAIVTSLLLIPAIAALTEPIMIVTSTTGTTDEEAAQHREDQPLLLRSFRKKVSRLWKPKNNKEMPR
jgi:hypothetical protein